MMGNVPLAATIAAICVSFAAMNTYSEDLPDLRILTDLEFKNIIVNQPIQISEAEKPGDPISLNIYCSNGRSLKAYRGMKIELEYSYKNGIACRYGESLCLNFYISPHKTLYARYNNASYSAENQLMIKPLLSVIFVSNEEFSAICDKSL